VTFLLRCKRNEFIEQLMQLPWHHHALPSVKSTSPFVLEFLIYTSLHRQSTHLLQIWSAPKF